MYDTIFNRKGLSLERLRRFCEVAGSGSIAEAEERNRRAQPSYSRDIAALEAYFGFPLFGRTSGPARAGRRMAGLTAHGRALQALATDMLHRLEEYQDFSDTPRRLRIGGGETVMQWIVGAHTHALTTGFPRTTVEICNCATQEETIAALHSGRLDFAIVDEAAMTDAPFRPRATPLGTLSYALYLRRETLTNTTRRTRHRLLSQIPWIALRDADRTATETITELDNRNISVQLAATLTTFRQAAATLKGRNLAALFPTVAEREMTALGFARMDHPDLQTIKVPISLLYNEDQLPQHPYLPAAAETLGRIMVPLDAGGEKRA
jgi:DNA-binding transcriptional LysR family regulator